MASKFAATVGFVTVGILGLLAILGTDGAGAVARGLSTSVTGNQDRRLDGEDLYVKELEAKKEVIRSAGTWAVAGPLLHDALMVHLPLYNQVRAMSWSCKEHPTMCWLSLEQLWCNSVLNEPIKDYLKCSKKPPKGGRLLDENPELKAKMKEEEAKSVVYDAAAAWIQAKEKTEALMAKHLQLYKQLRAKSWGCSTKHACGITLQQLWCKDEKMPGYDKNVANFLSCNGEGADHYSGSATGLPR